MDFVRALSNWLRRWVTPFDQLPQNADRGPADKAYRIYTRAFDLVIGGEELAASPAKFIEILPSAGWEIGDAALLAAARHEAELNLAAVSENLRASLSPAQREDTAITLLLDHSGSMRGMRALAVADFAEAFADVFSELGIAVEVLGFTTRSWKGGDSRKDWLAHGRPKYLGRLCDLLHVVHREAKAMGGKPHRFAAMREPALYKENIDGEALLWARDRLMAQTQGTKVLVAISDGAPVDDATLLHNWAGILSDHIQAVIVEIENDGQIVLGGIGIEHEVDRYYSTSITATPCHALGRAAPAFIEQLLTAAHARKRADSAALPDTSA